MKNFCQKPMKKFALEKDDGRNLTGMQLRVWLFNNETTILIRMLKHNSVVHKKLWDGKRSNGDVERFILSLLKEWGIIISEKDWEFSINYADSFRSQDEFEEKEQCIYYSWSVKPELLNFFVRKGFLS
jgi:hypothetical protein